MWVWILPTTVVYRPCAAIARTRLYAAARVADPVTLAVTHGETQTTCAPGSSRDGPQSVKPYSGKDMSARSSISLTDWSAQVTAMSVQPIEARRRGRTAPLLLSTLCAIVGDWPMSVHLIKCS